MKGEILNKCCTGIYIHRMSSSFAKKWNVGCLRDTQLLGYCRPDLLFNVESEPRHAWSVWYANNIRYSQEVSHPRTNRTRRCLTSLILRETIKLTGHGRWQTPETIYHRIDIRNLSKFDKEAAGMISQKDNYPCVDTPVSSSLQRYPNPKFRRYLMESHFRYIDSFNKHRYLPDITNIPNR